MPAAVWQSLNLAGNGNAKSCYEKFVKSQTEMNLFLADFRHLVPLCEDVETNGPSFVRLLVTAVAELRCFKLWPSDGTTCFSGIFWVMLASVLTDENAIWRLDFKSGINVMAVEVEVAKDVETVFIAVFNGTPVPQSCLPTWSLLSAAPSFAIGGDEGGGRGEAAVAPVVEWPHLNNWA